MTQLLQQSVGGTPLSVLRCGGGVVRFVVIVVDRNLKGSVLELTGSLLIRKKILTFVVDQLTVQNEWGF